MHSDASVDGQAQSNGVVPLETIISVLEQKGTLSKKNAQLVRKAYVFMEDVHSEHTRSQINPDTGEAYPFTVHTTGAALSAAEETGDAETTAGTLLHDVIDMTGEFSMWYTLRQKFGDGVAGIVACRTGFDAWMRYGPEDDLEKQIWKRKIFSDSMLYSFKTPKGMVAGIADRLNNLESLTEYNTVRLKRVWSETINFILPMAKIITPGMAEQMGALLERYKPEEDFLSKYEFHENHAFKGIGAVSGLDVWKLENIEIKKNILQHLKYFDPSKIKKAFPSAVRESGRVNLNPGDVLGELSDFEKFQFRNEINKLKGIDKLSAAYAAHILSSVLTNEHIYSLEGRLFQTLPKPHGNRSLQSTVNIDENSQGAKILSLDITLDELSESEFKNLMKNLRVPEPILMLRNSNPTYRFLFDGRTSAIAEQVKGTDYPFFVVNVYLKDLQTTAENNKYQGTPKIKKMNPPPAATIKERAVKPRAGGMYSDILAFVKSEPSFKNQEFHDEIAANWDRESLPKNIKITMKPYKMWAEEAKKLRSAKKYKFPSENPRLYLDQHKILPASMFYSFFDNLVTNKGERVIWLPNETIYVEDNLNAILIKYVGEGMENAIGAFDVSVYGVDPKQGATFSSARLHIFDVQNPFRLPHGIEGGYVYGTWMAPPDYEDKFWMPMDPHPGIIEQIPNEIYSGFITSLEQIAVIEKGLVPNSF